MRSNELIARSTLPRHEAERLLAVVTGESRTKIVMGIDVTAQSVAAFEALASRRVGGEPLQYIEGWVPFGPVEIAVDRRVLVPRPETELLFERMAERFAEDPPKVIVDLCTGSGNLALAFKATFPDAEVYATDASADALAVARGNAERNQLDVAFVHGDLFDPLPDSICGTVDLVVANPPYLAASELADLPVDVLREPVEALVAGPQGDELVGRIANEIGDWMSPRGQFGIEVSEFHASDVVGRFSHLNATVEQDLTGRDRFVTGHSVLR